MRRRPTQPKLSAAPGSVRIIGGHLRGSRLAVPDLPGLRPTPDRARETLFNWLAPVLPGSRCLDLFAGTGVLGLEAVSRGAAEVWLVERDGKGLAALQANVARLGANAARIIAADALAWLDQPAPVRFDVVFLDPPYAAGLLQPAWAALLARGWLAPGALVHAEWPRDQPAPLALAPWRSARAGAVVHALFRADAAPG